MTPRHLVAILLFPLIFSLPVENMVMIEGLGTINRLLGLAVAPVVFFFVLASGRINSLLYWVSLGALLLIVYAGFSIAWAPDTQRAYISWFSLVQVMVLTLMIAMAGLSFGLKVICVPYLLGALYGALTVIYHAAMSDSIRRVMVENFNPNWMSFLLVMSGVCLFVLIDSASLKARLFYFLIWCLVGLAVFLLGSRGGLGFFLVMSLAILAKLSFTGKLALLLSLSAALLVFNSYIQADIDYLLMRFLTVGDLISSGDFSGRGGIWQEGMAGLGNPVFGAGLSGFNELIGRAPHNAFLAVFFNLGMIGLLLFLSLWGLLALLLYRSGPGWPAATMLLLALMVPMSLANWEFHKGLWFAFAVIFAFAMTRLIELEETSEAEVPMAEGEETDSHRPCVSGWSGPSVI